MTCSTFNFSAPHSTKGTCRTEKTQALEPEWQAFLPSQSQGQVETESNKTAYKNDGLSMGSIVHSGKCEQKTKQSSVGEGEEAEFCQALSSLP